MSNTTSDRIIREPQLRDDARKSPLLGRDSNPSQRRPRWISLSQRPALYDHPVLDAISRAIPPKAGKRSSGSLNDPIIYSITKFVQADPTVTPDGSTCPGQFRIVFARFVLKLKMTSPQFISDSEASPPWHCQWICSVPKRITEYSPAVSRHVHLTDMTAVCFPNGPNSVWHKVAVCCCDGELDGSGRWADWGRLVLRKLSWSTCEKLAAVVTTQLLKHSLIRALSEHQSSSKSWRMHISEGRRHFTEAEPENSRWRVAKVVVKLTTRPYEWLKHTHLLVSSLEGTRGLGTELSDGLEIRVLIRSLPGRCAVENPPFLGPLLPLFRPLFPESIKFIQQEHSSTTP